VELADHEGQPGHAAFHAQQRQFALDILKLGGDPVTLFGQARLVRVERFQRLLDGSGHQEHIAGLIAQHGQLMLEIGLLLLQGLLLLAEHLNQRAVEVVVAACGSANQRRACFLQLAGKLVALGLEGAALLAEAPDLLGDGERFLVGSQRLGQAAALILQLRLEVRDGGAQLLDLGVRRLQTLLHHLPGAEGIGQIDLGG